MSAVTVIYSEWLHISKYKLITSKEKSTTSKVQSCIRRKHWYKSSFTFRYQVAIAVWVKEHWDRLPRVCGVSSGDFQNLPQGSTQSVTAEHLTFWPLCFLKAANHFEVEVYCILFFLFMSVFLKSFSLSHLLVLPVADFAVACSQIELFPYINGKVLVLMLSV